MLLPNRSLVKVKWQENYFVATVVGVATTDQPVIGPLYVVEPMDLPQRRIPEEILHYPYDCIVVPGCWLEILDEDF